MTKIGTKSLSTLYQKAWEQFSEDRDSLKSVFDELKTLTITREDYAINGQNLAKFAELRIKNTSSLIELVKLSFKESEDKNELTSEDLELIQEELKKESDLKEDES